MTSESHRLRFLEDVLKEILPQISRTLGAMNLCAADKTEVHQIVRIYFFENIDRIYLAYAGGKTRSYIVCYARSLAKNRAINLIRRNKNHPVLDTGYLEYMPIEGESDSLLQKDDTRLLRYQNLLKNLPPSQQNILTLRQEGLKNETIAKQQGISVGTVREHYSEGLKRMRHLVRYAP